MDGEASSTGARFARAMVAHRAAAARDPRRFRFGYLAGDPATGAPGAFVWFASSEELFDFLGSTEIALLQFDDDDARRIVAALRRAIGRTRDLARIERDALSAAFEGWSEVLWIGTFGGLCAQGGAFTTDLRAAFRAEHGLGEHAGPIVDDELELFVRHLRAPGGATTR